MLTQSRASSTGEDLAHSGRGQDPQVSNPPRRWCFLIRQQCGYSSAPQDMHFYVDSFAEALSIAETTPLTWRHEAIYLVLAGPDEIERPLHLIQAAYLLDSAGFLCCLESGLHLLDPAGDESSFGQKRAGRRVYG